MPPTVVDEQSVEDFYALVCWLDAHQQAAEHAGGE
jgi:hypothetical protein